MNPSQEQILSIIRLLLALVGSYLVTKGYLTTDQSHVIAQSFEQIVGPLMTVAPIIWSMFANTKRATVAKAADIVAIPAVSQAQAGITHPQIVPTRPPAK